MGDRGTGEGRKGAAALGWGGMAMLLGETEEEAVLMREGGSAGGGGRKEGDISAEGEAGG